MSIRLWETVAAVALAAFAAPVLAQEPLGNEFEVSPVEGDAPVVASDGDGAFLVVWSNDDIVGRRFDASGQPTSDTFMINVYTTGSQGRAALAADPSGSFIVVWEDFGRERVYGRRVDPEGNPVGGELQISGAASGEAYRPRVAADAQGNFVVVWDDGSYYGDIFARRFEASGTALGAGFQVNGALPAFDSAWLPDVAMDAGGEFVVAWQSGQWNYPIGYEHFEILARRFDASGDPLADEFQVNTQNQGGYNGQAAVAVDSDGEFVIAWGSGSRYNYFQIFLDVQGRRFDAAGVSVGSQFRVSTPSSDLTQGWPATTFDDHELLVTWQSGDRHSGLHHFEIVGRRFDVTGYPVGDEFQVNTFTTGVQQDASVAATTGGQFVVVWGEFGSAPIRGQRFARPGPLLSASGTCPGQAAVTLSDAPPGTEVAVVAAENTEGFTKGGTICNGTRFAIGEPFVLPPAFVIVDGGGNGTTTVQLPEGRCWIQALALASCETSNAVEVP